MTNQCRMCLAYSSLRVLAIVGAAMMIVVLVSTEVRAGFTTYGFGGGTGVFSVACAGPADGGLPNGNIPDNRVFFKAGSNCTAAPLTGSASESFTSGNVSASGTVAASVGSLQGFATMSTDTQNSVFFPAGFGDTGWIDTMLLGGNPQLNGQVAIASIMLNVSGTLAASGPNVFARLQLAVSSELANSPALHQPFYFIQSPQPGLTISDTLVLDLPFIIGTPSEFLIRAMPQAMTSSATSFGNNTSTADFFTTITWGGIQSVTVAGTPLADFTATGGTGIDWTQPFGAASAVPAPSVVPLLILGLAAIGFTRRFTR